MPQNLEKVAEQLDKGDEATRDFKGIYQVWPCGLYHWLDAVIHWLEAGSSVVIRPLACNWGGCSATGAQMSRHVPGGA